MTSARKKAYLALLFTELMYGASQPIVKSVLHDITSSDFLFFRYCIAAPLVIPILIIELRKHQLTLKQWLRILFTETVGIFNIFILYTGLTYVTSLQSSLILQMRPIFVTIGGILLLGEHEENHEWIGLTLAALGTFSILLKPIFFHEALHPTFTNIGLFLILITNIIFTLDTLLVKRYYPKIPKLLISSIHMWIGLLLISFYLGIQNKIPSFNLLTNPSVLFAAGYMSIFGSIIGLTLTTYSYSKIEASEATLFMYLQPLVYIPLSVFWLKEPLTYVQIVGMAAIFAGVWWAERRPHKKRKLLRHGIPLLNRIRLAQSPEPIHPRPHR